MCTHKVLPSWMCSEVYLSVIPHTNLSARLVTAAKKVKLSNSWTLSPL